jgi:hypothetical protein
MAYQFKINPVNDRSEWPKVDVGFEMVPPPLQRAVGRPRKQRIKASGEPGKRGPYQYKKVLSVWTYREIRTRASTSLPKEREKVKVLNNFYFLFALQVSFTNLLPCRKTKSEDAEASTTVLEPFVMPHSSPGVTSRRMASLSPTSPSVTTRRMVAISPGGISHRIIIE